MSEIVFRRIFSILASYPLLFQLTPLAWRQRNVVKILHNFTNTVIRNRREQLRNKPILVAPKLSDDEIYDKKKLTFLDLLLTATADGKPLDDDGIREEVDTFMFEVFMNFESIYDNRVICNFHFVAKYRVMTQQPQVYHSRFII